MIWSTKCCDLAGPGADAGWVRVFGGPTAHDLEPVQTCREHLYYHRRSAAGIRGGLPEPPAVVGRGGYGVECGLLAGPAGAVVGVLPAV